MIASRIADPALAADGHRAIEWARRHSPVLDRWVRERISDGALRGRRVAVVVHLEAKTAFLATVLADAGAQVTVAGSNPATTRDDVAAALVDRGIAVHSSRLSGMQRWEQDLEAVAATRPELVVDDGAELTVRMVRAGTADTVDGVTEQTTTGVARLRRLHDDGKLALPAIAANDAACKHLFDNRYGTGQSTIQALLALTNLRMPASRFLVVGYGWVGRGIATYARQLGARVAVAEVDPIRALEAHMDGHTVSDLATLLPDASVVITSTGGVDALDASHIDLLADGVVLANAGHHDREIDVGAIAAAATDHHDVRPGVTRYRLGQARDVHVLAHGALVNIAGGLGHPVEIMDLSFAVQACACHLLALGGLAAGVHAFPRELDEAIARARLAEHGIVLDARESARQDTLAGLLDASEHTETLGADGP